MLCMTNFAVEYNRVNWIRIYYLLYTLQAEKYIDFILIYQFYASNPI